MIGSGIKAINQFTLESEAYLRWADAVYFCVADPATERWILENKPQAVDLYTLYDNDKHRAETYIQMSELMLQAVRRGLNVVGIFYGHPGVFVNPSHRAIAIARQEGHEAFMLPAVSALDCLFADLGIDPSRPGCQVIEATDLLLRRRTLLVDSHVVIFQVGSVGDLGFRFAGFPNTHLPLLVRYLQEVYGNDYEIVHYIASQYSICEPIIERIRLSSFAEPNVGQKVTGISTFYVPPKILRGVDPVIAETLGLAKYRFPTGDMVISTPFLPSPAAYTRRELEIIAQLETHQRPDDYKPTRPSSGLYRLMKDLSLNASILREFVANPDSLLQRYPDLSESDRRAVLSRHYGYLRRAMQRSTREVATEFVRTVLRDPTVAQRYQALQIANSSGMDGRKGVQEALSQLGYDTSPEEVNLALTELMSEELSSWTGEYEVFSSGQRVARFSISASGVAIDGKAIKKYEFAGGVLSWNAAEDNDSFGNLKFSVLTSKDEEPLPDEAYIGPQFRGKFWRNGSECPVDDNVIGKVGVFSPAAGYDEFNADPPDIWVGKYNTHILSRLGSWDCGPSVALQKRETEVELQVDEKAVRRWAYSNGNLSWVQAAPRYSGSITFYQNHSDGNATFIEFAGRLWRGTEQSSPMLNAIGQRE